jgi:hypothetical protein
MPTTTQFDEVARNSRHLLNRIAFPLQTFDSANLRCYQECPHIPHDSRQTGYRGAWQLLRAG